MKTNQSHIVSHGVLIVALAVFSAISVGCQPSDGSPDERIAEEAFDRAAQNGRLANEGFVRSHRYLEAWLQHAGPETGLTPRNLDEDKNIWNARDVGADNYSFMVLTAVLTDRALFKGRLRDMLRTQARLTSRLGPLPDVYSFATDDFKYDEPDLGRSITGASEYIKDGLLPVTEWLGPSPWSERMIAMIDAIWKRAPVKTPYGNIPTRSFETNGEQLQALTRIYWMTGEEKYLNWAIRLGDYYLLGDHHPTRDTEKLRLRDHGNEIISGLAALYATVHFARPQKAQAYREPLHDMLDRILEVGRNEHDLFYNVINPKAGTVLDSSLADTWGYVLNAHYTTYLIDSTAAYRRAVRKALKSLNTHYRHYNWEGGSADGDADAIESALNLYNREPIASAAAWIDHQIQVMWSKQDSSHLPGDKRWRGGGIIEGWYGDGNFARTSLMYSLWKTKGLHIRPWRKDVIFGAVQQGDRLFISMEAEEEWSGKLIFDIPRHKVFIGLPLDWPRINQFPEWFTVKDGEQYIVRNLSEDTRAIYSGEDLREGLSVHLPANEEKRIVAKLKK